MKEPQTLLAKTKFAPVIESKKAQLKKTVAKPPVAKTTPKVAVKKASPQDDLKKKQKEITQKILAKYKR